MRDDITVVQVWDAKTIEQFRVSHPTWKLHYPEMWQWPWIVVPDRLSLNQQQVADTIGMAGLPNCRTWWWEPATVYETQRERMLSAWVHVPPMAVRTPWWMKIDTDAVALRRHQSWLDELDERSCYVASSWGYTKAKGGGGSALEWAERLERWGERFGVRRHLGLRDRVRGDKIKLGRMASWISFYRTAWSLRLSVECEKFAGLERLPVPSQDTVAWYYAAASDERRKELRHFGKRRGWTNCPRFEQLVRTVAIALGETT